MTTRTDGVATPWETRGADLARADGVLASRHAVLVTGSDTAAAARVAIGLGRTESARRRVAIGDLVGDVEPLVALLDADDVHGIVDSFLYGVSINKVARPVTGTDNLFVLPSGSEPVVTEEIFRSDRWRRLASGFREMGALLVLVAPADARGLDTLAGMLDGVITVDDDEGGLGARFAVLAAVSARPPKPPVPERTSARRTRGRPPVVLPRAEPAATRRRMLVPLLVVLALVAGGGATWWLRERREVAVSPAPVRRDTLAAVAPPAPAPDTLAMQLVVTNPQDSASAAAWAIELAMVSSEEGARMSAQKATGLAPVTWFPVRIGNDPDARWYRVVAGAWPTRAPADSALAALTASHALELPASVVQLPLALLVERAMGADSLRARAARYAQAGIPVYALVQADGTSNLYAGAFETPDHSTFLALAVQKLGGVPTLVYRIGRAP